LEVKDRFEEKVALVKFYPCFDPDIITWLLQRGYRGIIVEGSGLGHVNSECYGPLERAIGDGVVVGMTSQCIWGRVRMTVYDTGRDLLAMGVLPLDDMLPETALVKMMWALGNTSSVEEAKKLMKINIAGEISYKSDLQRRPIK